MDVGSRPKGMDIFGEPIAEVKREFGYRLLFPPGEPSVGFGLAAIEGIRNGALDIDA